VIFSWKKLDAPHDFFMEKNDSSNDFFVEMEKIDVPMIFSENGKN